jgi:hypothetical protein
VCGVLDTVPSPFLAAVIGLELDCEMAVIENVGNRELKSVHVPSFL